MYVPFTLFPFENCLLPSQGRKEKKTDRGSRAKKLLGAFQLYDINNDGLITYDEMLKIVQSIYDMTGDMVKLPSDEDTAEKVRSNSHLTISLSATADK